MKKRNEIERKIKDVKKKMDIFSSETKKLKKENEELRKEISRRKSEMEELIRIKNYIEEEKKKLNEKEKQVNEKEKKINSIIDLKCREREKEYEEHVERMVVNIKKQEMDTSIKLNIGGSTYRTNIETLRKIKNSFFDIMLDGKFNNIDNEKGEYFIDRNSYNFDIILDYLRGEDVNNIVDELSYGCKEKLKQDILFYGVEPMLSVFEFCIPKVLQNKTGNRKIIKFDTKKPSIVRYQVDININLDFLPNDYSRSREFFYIGVIKDTKADANTLKDLDGYYISNHMTYVQGSPPSLTKGNIFYQQTDFAMKNFDLKTSGKFTINIVLNFDKHTISFYNTRKFAKFYFMSDYIIPFVYSINNSKCTINNITFS